MGVLCIVLKPCRAMSGRGGVWSDHVEALALVAGDLLCGVVTVEGDGKADEDY
jgi:hypothetical protein